MNIILTNHIFLLVLLVNVIVSMTQPISANIRQKYGKNGMPTECECYEEFLNEYNNDDPFGSSLDVAISFGCPYYDDEDK